MRISRSAALKLSGLVGLTALAAAGRQVGVDAAGVSHVLAALGAAAGFAGQLLPEITGQLLLDSADAVGDSAARARGDQNRDVHRLIGIAIARVLERDATGTPSERTYLAQAAAAFRSNAWMEVELTPAETAAVGEPEAIRHFTGRPEAIKQEPVLSVEEWLDLVQKVAGPPGLEAHAVVRYATLRLRDEFAFELWQAAKDAAQTNDVAWPALTLRLLSELLGQATRAAEGNATVLGELARLRCDLSQVAEDVGRQIDVRIAQGTGASSARDLLMANVAQHRQHISATLDTLGTLVDGQRAIKETLDSLPAAIADRIRDGSPRRMRTDNLAAAGATRNLAFVGRTDKLDDLSRLFDDPDGPGAVAIVAGAGFGKTELARAFVNLRARPVDEDPTGWEGRWWLDGSSDGEIKSLRQHFETITGQVLPPEHQVASGESAPQAMAAWVEAQRRAIAQACSEGRCLLVIDNAESEKQLRQYQPANAGRLLATSRRQPIPRAVARTVTLDELSLEDARAMLVADRDDLRATRHEQVLTDLADHVGCHPLALAYASAALARPPYKDPGDILERMRQAEIGDGAHLLTEFDESDIGTGYKRPLAQSLSLLVDELSDPGSPTHDALAVWLLELASFCAPLGIPLEVFEACTGERRSSIERALFKLHVRSVMTLTESANVHRLTQSLVRGRVKRQGAQVVASRLQCLLAGLTSIHRWPATPDGQRLAHAGAALRTAAWPHAEAVVQHASVLHPSAGVDIPAATAVLRAELAWHLRDLAQFSSAQRHITAAIRWQEEQTPRDERTLSIWCAWRSSIRARFGDLEGAALDIARAIDTEEARTPPDEGRLHTWYERRAGIRQAQDDLAGAAADIERAIAWGERQTPRDDHALAASYEARARIRQGWSDLTGAADDINRAIEWREAQVPRDERALVVNYSLRARIRQRRGDVTGAAGDIARSIEWREAQSPRDEHGLAYDHAFRASIRQDAGDLIGAAEDIARAIAGVEAQIPQDPRGLAVCYARRASIRCDQGDLTGAARDIEQAIGWWEAHAHRYERGLAMWYALRATVRQRLGELTAAAADIAWAIARGEAHTPRDERYLALWRASRAEIRRDQAQAARRAGDPGLARELCDAAREDIVRAIRWYESNLPGDERRIGILRTTRASIERACGDMSDDPGQQD